MIVLFPSFDSDLRPNGFVGINSAQVVSVSSIWRPKVKLETKCYIRLSNNAEYVVAGTVNEVVDALNKANRELP